MKVKLKKIGLFFILLSMANVRTGWSQGTFQNLNFESAVIVPVVVQGITFAQFGPAFPGWTAYFNTTPLSSTALINYNDVSVGSSALGITTQATGPGSSIFNYTAILQGSIGTGQFAPEVSLAQTGLIPLGTLSLRFYGRRGFGNFFRVSLGGQSLTPMVLQDFGTYQEYGANISGFTGQTAELRFTQGNGPTGYGDSFLDEISFSPVAVIPEPGTWALLGLGGALLWSGVRRRRN